MARHTCILISIAKLLDVWVFRLGFGRKNKEQHVVLILLILDAGRERIKPIIIHFSKIFLCYFDGQEYLLGGAGKYSSNILRVESEVDEQHVELDFAFEESLVEQLEAGFSPSLDRVELVAARRILTQHQFRALHLFGSYPEKILANFHTDVF